MDIVKAYRLLHIYASSWVIYSGFWILPVYICCLLKIPQNMGGGACVLVLCKLVIGEEREQTLVLNHVNGKVTNRDWEL